jgi:hypothetical protein
MPPIWCEKAAWLENMAIWPPTMPEIFALEYGTPFPLNQSGLLQLTRVKRNGTAWG